MKKICFILIFLVVSISAMNAQVVTTDPLMPTENKSVVVYFHADKGDKGLMNYGGTDVYAHTGVITDKSQGKWTYVKAEWTVNIPECKLVKDGANLYHLNIGPGIREYYGVPADEKILKMAFVFRNGTRSKTGRDVLGADIFTDVFEPGKLQVSFTKPADRFSLADSGELFPVTVHATEADSVLLYLDGELIKKTNALAIDTAFVATGNSSHQLVAVAKSVDALVSDTSWFMVPGRTREVPLPAGVDDGITYASNDSVVFVLYAPGKNRVYLIGDFNGWLPDSLYQLQRDGARFWTGLGNLIPGKEYAFQYIIDDTIRVTDPYVNKVLDPDNDEYVPVTVYPDLKPYPEGKTTGITGVIQTGKESYSWGDDAFVGPAREDLIIYELLIRDFINTHSIADVKGKLDYLQTLGINAIELMPFNEFEGNVSWGYNPSFYFAPDKYYGTETAYKDFIQECHNRGIVVIMDMVLNHAYGQNPLAQMYYNKKEEKPAADNPWFNEESPNTVFGWGNDFNHESPATRYFVDRVIKYWLTEFKVDGYRFDFTKGFTNTEGDGWAYDSSRILILKRIYDTIQSVNAGAYMICEHFAENREEKELSDYGIMIWGNSNNNYNEAAMGYLNNSDFSWVSYKQREWTNPYLVGYMESHDEERLMYKNITYGNSNATYNIKSLSTALKRMELAGAFFFTVPGPKMIWQFGELGYDITIDFGGRTGVKPTKWGYLNNADRNHLYLTWAKMMDVRKKYPVFKTDDYTMTVGNDVSMKKIVLRHEEQDAVVIGNFGLTAGSMQPVFTKAGWWYRLFAGDSVNITNLNQYVQLQAGEYEIYTSSKIKSVISGTHETRQENTTIFPNPAGDYFYISGNRSINRVDIFNISGLSISSIINPTDNRVNISRLPQGFYLIKITQGTSSKTFRLLKK